MSIIIRQANIDDTNSLMEFIGNYWRENHILSQNRDFFLYEFKNENKLNIVIALEDTEIVGFFGFFFYNYSSYPDMAGSIWKIHPKIKDQLLGIKIRNYLNQIVDYRFFATPGPGPHMKPVYRILRMDWHQMEQFYIINNKIGKLYLTVNPIISEFQKLYRTGITILKANSIKEISDFLFDKKIVPQKDLKYIEKRYFNHPIYNYDIYYVKSDNKTINIIVCRTCSTEKAKAYRIVDFFGSLDYLPEISTYFYEYLVLNEYEYLDFISYGYDKDKLLKAGFNFLDNNSNTIIPNHYEPFVQSNVSIYCVNEKTDKLFIQHKADGDMDRPNLI
jgi:hypothetical protein